eukprot:jgi/Chlat1/8710/Chrsp89S08084
MKSETQRKKQAALLMSSGEHARAADLYFNLGQDKADERAWAEAGCYFKQAYDIAKHFLPREARIRNCRALGDVCGELGEHEQAICYQEEHLKLAQAVGNIVEQQRAHTQLGRSKLDYYQMNVNAAEGAKAIREAEQHFCNALDIATNNIALLHDCVPDAYNNLGTLCLELDRLEEARQYLNKGMKAFREEQGPQVKAQLYNSLGQKYMTWDLNVCKKAEDHEGVGKAFLTLALLMIKLGNKEEAETYLKEARRVFQRLPDAEESGLFEAVDEARETLRVKDKAQSEIRRLQDTLESLVKHSPAQSAEQLQLLKELLLLYDSYLDQFTAKNNTTADISTKGSEMLKHAEQMLAVAGQSRLREKGLARYLIATAFNHKKQHVLAAEQYELAAAAYVEANDSEGLVDTLLMHGNALDWAGRYLEAEQKYKEALKVAQDVDDIQKQISSYENLEYLYTERLHRTSEARAITKVLAELHTQVEQQPDASPVVTKHAARVEAMSTQPQHGRANTPNVKARLGNNLTDSSNAAGTHRGRAVKVLRPHVDAVPEQEHSHVPKKRRAAIVMESDSDEDDSAERNDHYKERFPEVFSAEPLVYQLPATGIDKTSDHARVDGGQDMPDANRPTDSAARSGPARVASVVVNIDGQCLKLLPPEDATTPVQWLMDEAVCLYSCNSHTGKVPILRLLMLQGATLSPTQSIQAALVDTANTSSEVVLTAVVDGWKQASCSQLMADQIATRDASILKIFGVSQMPMSTRYEAQCRVFDTVTNDQALAALRRMDSAPGDLIDLKDCRLTDADCQPLMTVLAEKTLTIALNLQNNRIGSGGMQYIMQMFAKSRQPGLCLQLNLSRNCLSPAAMFQLSSCLAILERLECLDLSYNPLTDSSARHIAAILQQAPGLLELKLQDCSIGTAAVRALTAALRESSMLATLDLSFNSSISAEALVSLTERLSVLPGFQHLSLAGIELDDTAAGCLGRMLVACKTLQSLDLSTTELGDIGAVAFAHGFGNDGRASLQSLSVRQCDITGRGAGTLVKYLNKVCGLASLDLSRNTLTQEVRGWRLLPRV